MPRHIDYLPVGQLQAAADNPKLHDEAALADSVDRFGYVEPIVLDERTGRLVAGHGRLGELRRREAAGAPPPDGIDTDGDGRWLVPVIRGWASKDDTEARAYLLASNRITEAGGWDDAALAEFLGQLADVGALEGTGFTADDLDDLVAALGTIQLPPGPTDAEHADHPDRAEPQPPREVQGLREVGLMFQAEHHRAYMEHLAVLKRAWGTDVAPLVVLRALAEAADRARAEA